MYRFRESLSLAHEKKVHVGCLDRLQPDILAKDITVVQGFIDELGSDRPDEQALLMTSLRTLGTGSGAASSSG